MTARHRFSAKGYRALCQGVQTTDAAHNRALRFVFAIRLSVMIACNDVCQNDSCDSLRLLGKTKSPRPSRYAYAYSSKTLEIVAMDVACSLGWL